MNHKANCVIESAIGFCRLAIDVGAARRRGIGPEDARDYERLCSEWERHADKLIEAAIAWSIIDEPIIALLAQPESAEALGLALKCVNKIRKRAERLIRIQGQQQGSALALSPVGASWVNGVISMTQAVQESHWVIPRPPSPQEKPPAAPSQTQAPAKQEVSSIAANVDAGTLVRPDPVAVAVALKKQHPDWSDRKIAKGARCSHSTLSRSEMYQSVKRFFGCDSPPRGNKDGETGNIDATDEC